MRSKSLALLLLLFSFPVALSAQGAQDKIWLGVSVEEPDGGGSVTVVEVVPSSPAAKAGLKVGDQVLQVGRAKVKDLDVFMETVLALTPGSTQSFSIRRKGKNMRLRVRLGSQAERIAQAKAKNRPAGGMVAKKVTPKKSKPKPRGKGRLGVTLEGDGSSVRIVEVEKGGPAALAGLQRGDVIVKAGGKDVRDIDSLIANIQKSGAGSRLALEVNRRGRTRKISPRLGGYGDQVAEPGRMAPPAKTKKAQPKKRTDKPAAKKPKSQHSPKIAKVLEQARKSNRLALILFFDPESDASKLTSQSLADPKVRGVVRSGYVGTKCDVLKEARVADRYGVMATPHFLVMDGGGRILGKFTGYQPANRLAARLQRYLTAYRAKAPAAAKPTSRPMAASNQPRAVEAKPSAASEVQRNQRILRQMQGERRRMEKLLNEMKQLEKRLKELKKK